jgi:hypothetical protein
MWVACTVVFVVGVLSIVVYSSCVVSSLCSRREEHHEGNRKNSLYLDSVSGRDRWMIM